MTRRFALVALLVLGGCQKLSETLKPPPKVLKSAEGDLEITVPGTWSDDSDPTRKLNDQAALQASDRPNELYVIVLTQPKEGLDDMSLEAFSKTTRTSQLESMTNAVEEGPKKRTINGLDAIEYVLKGTVDKATVVMKHVSVNGANRYHQVLVWTLKTKWDSEKAALDGVVDSLKEKAAAAKPAERAPAPTPAPAK